MNLNVQTDRTLVREAGKSTRYALLTFTAPEAVAHRDCVHHSTCRSSSIARDRWAAARSRSRARP